MLLCVFPGQEEQPEDLLVQLVLVGINILVGHNLPDFHPLAFDVVGVGVDLLPIHDRFVRELGLVLDDVTNRLHQGVRRRDKGLCPLQGRRPKAVPRARERRPDHAPDAGAIAAARHPRDRGRNDGCAP